MTNKNSLLAAVALVFACPAGAHITLETGSAEAGSHYKAVFKVGHGCDGSPVREIVVHIPPGVVGVKPMPKAGWALEITRAPLAVPLASHGKTVADAPSSVRWSGGALADDWYDEFVLVGRLPEQAGRLYWKVSQICDRGRIDWFDLPSSEGKSSATPAAILDVLPKGRGREEHKH